LKRFVSLLLVLTMLMTMAPAVFAAKDGLSNFEKNRDYMAGQFADVPDDAWYAESVKEAYEYGLVNGAGADSFNPAGNITIAETLALACRIYNIYHADGAAFEQGAPWYQVYVDYAVEKGIIAEGVYTDYAVKATRSQFAAILAAALPEKALDKINEIKDGDIPDVAMTDENAEKIYRLYRAGILTGNDAAGTFGPQTNIQRSAVAAIITRMASKDLRKKVELISPNTLCKENLQGRWLKYNTDGKVTDEYVFSGDSYTYASSYLGYYIYESGTFTVEGNDILFTGVQTRRTAGKDPTVDNNFTETQPIGEFSATSFGEKRGVNDVLIYFTKTDDATIDFAKQVIAEIEWRDPVPTAQDYAYLAGTDFRSVRRQYSSAVAQAGYVTLFTNENGETCVLTYVRYKIISNYYVTTLHNLTTGRVITNPSDYYSGLADRAYGANRINYLSLASEVLGHEIKANRAVASILQGGGNTGNGVYVNAATLNR